MRSGSARRATATCPSTATVAGHEVTFVGTRTETNPSHTAVIASFRIDGGQAYAPQIQQFPNSQQAIGKPSVKNSPTESILLALLDPPTGRGAVRVRVIVQPLIVWLWTGAAVMALGSVLAAFPGRRRNPIDPVSAPVPGPAEEPEGDDEPALAGAR